MRSVTEIGPLTIKFSCPPMMKDLTDILLINKNLQHLIFQFLVYKLGQQWWPKCIVKILLIKG